MNLQEFLNANPVDNITDEVVISDRLKDSEGNLFNFKIKAMSSAEYEETRKKTMSIRKGGRVELDMQAFQSTIVINNTLVPSFKDADSIKKLGCNTPDEYLNKVLLPGEITELFSQIQRLSGFKSMDELKEEAKN